MWNRKQSDDVVYENKSTCTLVYCVVAILSGEGGVLQCAC